MRLNYNFAFKNSKLTPWERPAPPNLLISDASLNKKFLYLLKQFNSNKGLYYPPTIVLALALVVQALNLYPKIIVKKTAITGALTSRKFERFFLGSIFNIINYTDSIEFDISIPILLGLSSLVFSGEDSCPPTNAQKTSEISSNSSKS